MSLNGTNEHGSGVPWNLKPALRRLEGTTNTSFQIYTGSDKTGDIYNWDNVRALYDTIAANLKKEESKNTHTTTPTKNSAEHHRGMVHLVVADGGFDAQRNSERQEAIAQEIVVGQCAAALHLLRRGGGFVVKVFGFRTACSRRMVRYLYGAFGTLVVVKPVTSRPASAERYLVCLEYEGVANDFDGLRWRDSMLAAETSVSMAAEVGAVPSSCKEEVHDGDALSNMLDSMDHDMLHLNIQACFQILSCLEIKEVLPGEGKGRKRAHSTNGQVDISMYKHHWKLGGR